MSDLVRLLVGVAGLALVRVVLSARQPSTSPQGCDAPLIAGICDPYVPGAIITGGQGKTLLVINTWPEGPAEKAGICSGDQITAVNDVLVSGHTFSQMLEEIASPSPSPITLKVTRGTQDMEFHFERVRESTLAQLSHEKFLRLRNPFLGVSPGGVVPLDETREELQELGHFCDGIDRRAGFKFVEGMDVPEGTPDEQAKKLAATRPGGPEDKRPTGWTPFARGESSSVPGFKTVLLKNPEEVLVDFVYPNSPAQRAGLFPGDEIAGVNGHSVAGLNADQLSDLILKPDVPREISLKLRRGTSTVNLNVSTQKLAEFAALNFFQLVAADPPADLKPDSFILGFVVLYAENPREAIVERVEYPSPAFDAGLHVGDRILKIGAVPIEQIAPQLLREKLQTNGAAEFELEVSRLGKQLEFRIKPTTYAETEAKIRRKIVKNRPVPLHCPEG